MIFKRLMTELEIDDKWPLYGFLKEEVEAAGATMQIVGFIEIDIERANIKPGEGACSRCHTPTVQVEWGEDTDYGKMTFMGLACPHCKHILEFAGFSDGPIDFEKLLGSE